MNYRILLYGHYFGRQLGEMMSRLNVLESEEIRDILAFVIGLGSGIAPELVQNMIHISRRHSEQQIRNGVAILLAVYSRNGSAEEGAWAFDLAYKHLQGVMGRTPITPRKFGR